MGYIIAMAGKGGTGKSTTASLIARIIKEKNLGSVLAIDADPNSNLGELLGIDVEGTVGKILDEISTHPEKIPAGMPKDRFIEFQVQSAVCEGKEGIDLLVMGKPEGPGCYCYVNNVLRAVITKLIKDYDYIIIDNEAGLEHLSRRTTRAADALVVLSDSSSIGIKSAKKIVELTKELKLEIKKSYLLINRTDTDINRNKVEIAGLEFLGCLPFDTQIEKLSIEGEPVKKLDHNAKALKQLIELGEKIWKCN